MSSPRSLLSRLKLRHLLFLLLLLSGIIPLAISSFLLIGQNRDLLETQEMSYLTRSARFLSVELDSFLADHRSRLELLGRAVLEAPPEASIEAKLAQGWLAGYVESYLGASGDVVAVRLLDPTGKGRQFLSEELGDEGLAALREAFDAAIARGEPAFRLVAPDGRPRAVMSVPIAGADGAPRLVAEAVVGVRPMETFFAEEAQGEVGVFLVDREGDVVWSKGADPATERAVAGSDLVRNFLRFPLNLTAPYTLGVEGRSQRMLARISPVSEPGWGVLVHKPVSAAFQPVRRMVVNTAASSAILVALAMLAAIIAARRISRPIQRLAESTHKIAAGKFDMRVAAAGLGLEIHELARDFNQMGAHVQQYVDQLRDAARANRELFIGSMRAFVAAVDAKDPYTRGHSERVAAHSRTISKYLGQSETFQHHTWVGALLHDVGKIGIDDNILKKGGVLTAEEYDQMKQHPVIGAEIMSRIEELKPMIPAIRWHHEAWNGLGYPDGLRGEQIPLIARIVAVADTFDAITTNRPYQRAYDDEFAVETIRKLAGPRFDAKVVTAFLQAYEDGQIQVRKPRPVPPATDLGEAAVSG